MLNFPPGKRSKDIEYRTTTSRGIQNLPASVGGKKKFECILQQWTALWLWNFFFFAWTVHAVMLQNKSSVSPVWWISSPPFVPPPSSTLPSTSPQVKFLVSTERVELCMLCRILKGKSGGNNSRCWSSIDSSHDRNLLTLTRETLTKRRTWVTVILIWTNDFSRGRVKKGLRVAGN